LQSAAAASSPRRACSSSSAADGRAWPARPTRRSRPNGASLADRLELPEPCALLLDDRVNVEHLACSRALAAPPGSPLSSSHRFCQCSISRSLSARATSVIAERPRSSAFRPRPGSLGSKSDSNATRMRRFSASNRNFDRRRAALGEPGGGGLCLGQFAAEVRHSWPSPPAGRPRPSDTGAHARGCGAIVGARLAGRRFGFLFFLSATAFAAGPTFASPSRTWSAMTTSHTDPSASAGSDGRLDPIPVRSSRQRRRFRPPGSSIVARFRSADTTGTFAAIVPKAAR